HGRADGGGASAPRRAGGIWGPATVPAVPGVPSVPPAIGVSVRPLFSPGEESTLTVAPPRATVNALWMPPATTWFLSSSYWITSEPAVNEPVAPVLELSE